MLDRIALEKLRRGGIGVLPTDTLYGVVGQALRQKTVQRLYKVKGRKPTKPLIILIASLSDLKKFGIDSDIIQTHKRILEAVWPGPVSVILPVEKKSQIKLRYLHRDTKSLAFRLPKKKTLQEFLKKTGPLVAPSANPEGLEPAQTIAQAKKYFGPQVDFYSAGGRKKGNPSALISLLENTPKILRGNLKLPV
jgi:L-threonylcarbamoyladenylate synthase